MKKLLFYILALPVLVFALYGCDKLGISLSPEIIVSSETVTYGFLKCEGSVSYRIENPKEGAEVEAVSSVDWITGVSVREDKISFTVEKNSEETDREGVIGLTYGNAEQVTVLIRQEKYVKPVVSVDPIGPVSAFGGRFNVSCIVKNPIEGVELEVSSSKGWVKGFPTKEGKISFTVEANIASSSRSADISVRYPEAENCSMLIQQDGLNQIEALDGNGTANCYIVSKNGTYMFATVKGNSRESIGDAASAEVLWETSGTDVAPQKGALIKEAGYGNGTVVFNVSSQDFKKGNAVIAVKDADGTVLWSWHIWLTDQPEDQVYKNKAGTMMDRNLGATSATPGDVGALGLFYQWGRKDPFLGSSSISGDVMSKSTIGWPSAVESTSSTGTIAYSVSNPTTFIINNNCNSDWYYTGSEETDNTRWQAFKTIYDPCPPGYRVPDGGETGIWPEAFGTSSYSDENAFDSINKGFNFGSSGKGTIKLSDSVSTCWYPASGCLYDINGSLLNVGRSGFYWSCSPSGSACCQYFNHDGFVYPSSDVQYRALGNSVRCLKESVNK